MTLLQSSLCDVKFRQIERNGPKFSHTELSNSVISYIFNSAELRIFDHF